MECIIAVKNGRVKYYTLPENCDSCKYLEKAVNLEGKCFDYETSRQYICLTLKAIMNAPKGTQFWYDFSDKRVSRRRVIDYLLDYGLDDNGDLLSKQYNNE